MFSGILEWLDRPFLDIGPVLHVGTVEASPAELIGCVTGAATVLLVARQIGWAWPIGIVNNLMFLALFLASGLYAGAGLQVVFILVALYGWWKWRPDGGDPHRRHTSPGKSELGVVQASRSALLVWGVGAAVVAVGLWQLLDRVTDSEVPLWDGVATALALTALVGQTRKQIEAWYVWILADLVYIPLYAHQQLWLTSALYVLYVALCWRGYRAWKRSLTESGPAASSLPAAAAGRAG